MSRLLRARNNCLTLLSCRRPQDEPIVTVENWTHFEFCFCLLAIGQFREAVQIVPHSEEIADDPEFSSSCFCFAPRTFLELNPRQEMKRRKTRSSDSNALQSTVQTLLPFSRQEKHGCNDFH
ncbi:hypothetical protein AVEN_195967-1 [Araneus ventricosus]|uniref:Uncharacterized protein n=1 Tax=Araneus ventricosus TaxID=182803 RepID=A0A4Y2SGI9_ARAVE|nr:hypothetical protein AVEN_227896-1 [Araneus ventricosus]GBN83035.1 hypothetical protein AVEN_201114-1 [Araneus ventricosus]GBN86706.1 hypothetical protein AVEN_221100-1 [Araneus ventricosus]GBN86712.1 hypothetical protein AVEN_195967-1 [Araneus ventricosus]